MALDDVWERGGRPLGLEARLRARAPAPPPRLSTRIADGIFLRRRSERRQRVARVSVAAALTCSTAAALGVTGGAGYAASAVLEAAEAVVALSAPSRPAADRSLSAGGDQYRPGFGWGDPNHNHTGPPGLRREAGALAPPLRAADRLAAVVSTRVTITEQAHLYISVIDPRGRFLLLTQSSRRGGSVVGAGVSGPQTKFIRYSLKVPRTIPIRLRVPANLLRRGQVHRIRIVAFDPEGNRSQLLIRFRA